MNEREQALAIMYRESIEPAVRRRWLALAQGLRVVPIKMGGEVIGCVTIKGNVLHVAATAQPPGSPRRVIRQTLARVIRQYGSAKTSVMADNAAGLAFCRRLGFVVTGEDQGVIHLTCSRPRHA